MKITGKRILLYLLISFGVAWGAWIGCYLLGVSGNVLLVVNMAVMWTPAAAVGVIRLADKGGKVLACSLRPRIRGNIRVYLSAWLIPALASALGGLLYFCVFRGDYDSSYSYLTQLMAQGGGTAGSASISLVIAAQIIGALSYGPLINMFFALGEEIGWRGFLFPALSQRLSKTRAHLLTGLIWGLWHTPINMMGHNYGAAYPGYPWLGILAMCVFTFSAGVFLSWLTEKSDSIWPAALAHGSINAAAGIPFLFLSADAAPHRVWGPALSGLMAGIPLLAFGIVLLRSGNKQSPVGE